MQTTASSEFYSIGINPALNRIYLTLVGFWGERPERYLSDLKHATSLLKPGYTALVNLVSLKTPPQEVGKIHVEAQHILMQSGLHKTAEIRPEKFITTLAAKGWAEKSNMNVQMFANEQEATSWLNQ